tara:strand:- start:422 stop:799 length:378 start_codon:yes stop_codon:yes gene_type:complete
MILFLLSLMACHKPLTHIGAKNYFSNQNCGESLKYHLGLAGCVEMAVVQTDDAEWLIRCHKPKSDRGDFWDNYVFRITPSMAGLDHQYANLIEEHTICIDERVRIEAYPPEGVSFEIFEKFFSGD